MAAPYASVILSTLNRSATLPWSLASVQAQTERQIDIAVVLDGATEACRDIAVAAAQSDGRIRICDFAKDSRHGEENVDRVVATCRAERIFYIDDDDLWLPRHIERLGPLLDDADIADSRICSVDRSGALHLGPCRGCAAPMRAHLATGRLKMLYDTHIGHRRDAYGRFSTWLAPAGMGDPVWGFLAGFAGNDHCRWASCDAVTALSIHGAARRDMGPGERGSEIARWAGRLGDLEGALAGAHSVFHLFRLLLADPPQGGSLEEYLARRGGYGGALPGPAEGDLFALFTAQPPTEAAAVALARALAEPVESGYMFESIAGAYFKAYGQLDHERILLQAAAPGGANPASRMASYSVALCRRDANQALAVARDALAQGPDSIGGLARWVDRLSHWPR